MKLIVISKPDFFEEEARYINTLFAAGMQYFHLRKPECTRKELLELISRIEEQYHSKLTLHHHHDLAGEFGIRRLHFPEKHRYLLSMDLLEMFRDKGFGLSTSAHDLVQLSALPTLFGYSFYGPVFDSISKPGHKGIVGKDFSLAADKHKPEVIALGGVHAGNICQARKMHFDGAAVLGAVWESADPVQAFCELNKIANGKTIARLHFISNETPEMTHLESIRIALQAGLRWIQLRVKNKQPDEIFSIALQAKKLCDDHQAKLIINDFPSIAKTVNAHGLHLGLDDMPVAEARAIVGNEMIIGGTANTFEHIMQRIEEGADYVGLGPFRFTTTKQKLSPIIGLEGFQKLMQRLREHNATIPVIAIGGIRAEDIAGLQEAGVHGVAMSSAVTNADRHAERTADFLL